MTSRDAYSRLFINNIALWGSVGLYTPFIGSFYRLQGLSVVQIGLLTTIISLSAIFIQPLWAYLSDTLGKHRAVFAAAALGNSFSVLVYLCGSGFYMYFFATIMVAFFNSSLIPLSDTIVTTHARDYGVDFAKIRIGGTVTYAFVVFIIGIYLKKNPSSMFLFASGGFFILALVILSLPPLHIDMLRKKNEISGKIDFLPNKYVEILKGFKNVFKTPDVIYILFLILITQIGLVYHNSFIGAYIIELGYNQFYVGIFSALSAISEVPILLVINKIQKRLGPFKLLYISCFMAALRLFLVSLGNIKIMLLAQILQSVSYMTSYYCGVTYIRENTYPEKSALGQSIMVIFQTGIASILGSAIGGFLFQHIGFPKGFRLSSLMVLILAIIIIFVYKNRHKKKIIT